ncbi:MFS transporter [Nocardioides panacihumi]|uniref:MFS transporter n=1 Tax=Nocardioides panacihumi TaxID=400774 RepID=A0ABN2RE16_9ACTN
MGVVTDLRSEPASLWTGPHLRTTVGVFALAFLFAFEYLAVATVMPDVAEALDGLPLYAVAFSAPMATSVVAFTVVGPWCDRRGPRPAVDAGVVVFGAGLLVAGLAPTMPVFLVGRAIQGFGMGLLGVAVYVVVAQAYPERLRARAFTVLTGAWVLPALIGPAIAASVAAALGWRWVFLGVPVLVVAAWWLVHDAPSHASGEGARRRGDLGRAVVVAAAVLVVSLAGQRDLPGWPVLLAVACAAVLVAGPRLLPPGTWTGRRGLPSVIGTRGLIGAAFAGAEAYVPLLLTLQRGLSLTEAGWALTAGATTWFGGSWVAANWSALSDEVRRVRIGAVALAAGIAVFATAATSSVPLVVPMLGWALAGAGIGMAFSTLSVLTLSAASPGEEGRASSALQLNDAVVQALVLAAGSVVFAGFAASSPVAGATVLVLAAASIGALALLPASRLR